MYFIVQQIYFGSMFLRLCFQDLCENHSKVVWNLLLFFHNIQESTLEKLITYIFTFAVAFKFIFTHMSTHVPLG